MRTFQKISELQSRLTSWRMKLKLHAHNTDALKTVLSLVTPIRKYAVLRFTPTQLMVILVDGLSMTLEPQAWCKLQAAHLFDEIEVQSLRENTILLEINADLLLQTLRSFNRATSEGGLNIRLQRKDLTGQQGVTVGNGRTASLALFYSDTTAATTVNHTFRIPVKILKNTHEVTLLHEPELAHVDLMMRLPPEFVTMYRRLDKYKKAEGGANDLMTIRASRNDGGSLAFVLEEEGNYKVTVSWNDQLEVQRSASTQGESGHRPIDEATGTDQVSRSEDQEVVVRLKDWRMASRIVATCKTVVLLVSHGDSCVLHCLLDESGDAEVIYYMNGSVR